MVVLWILILGLFTNGARGQPAELILDLPDNTSVFSQLLLQLMSFDNSLSHYLSNMGRYTLFAPSDEAFEGLVKDGTVFRLLRPEYRMHLHSKVVGDLKYRELRCVRLVASRG